MKSLQIIVLFQLLTLVASCQTLKKQKFVKTPMPEWVKTKPQNSMYFIGVSSAPKKGFTPADYMASAQQKALGDLASSISTNIESSSVLSVIESNFQLDENYSKEIIASTSHQLEGYELVETWEEENFYWVYYRLSKSHYVKMREEKKQQSIEEAKNKYYQATELMGRQLQYNAFQFYAEALTSLKPYLGESTITEINGDEKDLGNTIFSALADFVNDINISFKESDITIKKGIEINPEVLSFLVIDKNKNPISGIPVKIKFTGSGLLRNSEVSSTDGKVYIALNKIKSSPKIESLSVNIDMLGLSRTAKDPIIKSVIKNLPASETQIRVNVEKPILNIQSEEKSFDQLRQSNSLKSSFEGLLASEFAVNSSLKSDFNMKITSNTTKNGYNYGEAQVVINYTIDLTDNNGNIIYRKSSSAEYSAADHNSADNKAYIELSKSIERVIIREVISAVNQ
ncbi:MAG: hypothetical protein GX793_06250 [Bacteroidales bacterium]|nr:LPP20 family lipoprotein [Bacteroidales bacterium]MCK9498349.1 LPP20 family lipoprotein [Bacteroidales bacterium]MDY0314927.1 LPP20 family lipoprotein [Bacteroidales bacterium]NLB86644.1 hypothetical protein [Bacteroidales bacterium]